MEKTIFGASELISLNAMMVGRGAPTEEDGIGYNKPDYSVCSFYYEGLSYGQLHDLAKRLVKYCTTQLNLDTETMTETAKHYGELAKEQSYKDAVSIEIGETETLVSFSYNYQFVNAIKSIEFKQRRYDREGKNWHVKNTHILQALKSLKEIGADVDNAIALVQDKIKIEPITEPKTDAEVKDSMNTIQIEEVGNDKYEVSFQYNKLVVETIKSLPYNDRKWNATKKVWTVKANQMENLKSMLDKIEGVDTSNFASISITAEPSKDGEVEKKAEPSIKLSDYSYLTRKPFEHQYVAGQFLLDQKKAILADDMGAGKTFSTIMAMNSLKGKKLVVCPASLKLNWKKEIGIVTDAKVNVINGKDWVKPTKDSWTIVNYDILGNHIDKILKSGFIVATFDEVHYCKAITSSGKPSSNRAKHFMKISNKVEYAFLLSGTPITNKTKDIFNLMKAVNHPLSNNFYLFGQRYCDAQHNGFGWSYDGSSNQAELNERLQGWMLRRRKEDLLDLPEKMRSFIPVDVDTREYMDKVDEYMRRRKVLTDKGQHLVYLNAMRHILAKEKVEHTVSLAKDLQEQGKPTVIFTNYKFVVDRLKKAFPKSVTITGDSNQDQRQDAVDRFQNGEVDVIICNLVAGGVGLTLTRSTEMLINDFDWTPANHTQAEDRIHRIGQNKNVNIRYVYSEGTFDERMAEILEVKLKNINSIIDGKNEGFLDGNDDVLESIMNYF